MFFFSGGGGGGGGEVFPFANNLASTCNLLLAWKSDRTVIIDQLVDKTLCFRIMAAVPASFCCH